MPAERSFRELSHLAKLVLLGCLVVAIPLLVGGTLLFIAGGVALVVVLNNASQAAFGTAPAAYSWHPLFVALCLLLGTTVGVAYCWYGMGYADRWLDGLLDRVEDDG